MTNIIRTQAEIADASTAALIETYNALTGKSITKFSSRAAGEVQVANAILSAKNKAGQAGVPKGAEPTAKTVAELDAERGIHDDKPAATPTAKPEKEEEVKTERADIRAKRYPSEAKKPAAKKKVATPAAKKKVATPAARTAVTYAFVRLTKPSVPRRPQAGSKRTQVLTALQHAFETTKGLKRLAIEDLNKMVKFDARSYVHKLAGQGWCEVVGE